METINDVSVDDISTFIKLTDRVLKIDNTCRRRSYDRRSTSTCSSNSVPCVPPNNKPDIIQDEHEIPSFPVTALSVVQPPVIINTAARRKPNRCKLNPTSKSSIKSTPTPQYLVVDTSFPSHVFNDHSLFVTYTPSQKVHQMPFGSSITIEGTGDVRLQVIVKGVSLLYYFRGCWYVLSSHCHILSSLAAISRGHQIVIAGRTPWMIFPHKDRLLKPKLPKYMPFTHIDGLVALKFNIPISTLSVPPTIKNVPHTTQSAPHPVVSMHASSSLPFAGLSLYPHSFLMLPHFFFTCAKSNYNFFRLSAFITFRVNFLQGTYGRPY